MAQQGLDESKRAALIIALTYKDSSRLESLPGVQTAAGTVKEALEAHKFQVKVVTDDDEKYSIKNTSDVVKQHLKNFFKKCNEEEVNAMWVMFIGHGGRRFANVDNQRPKEEDVTDWQRQQQYDVRSQGKRGVYRKGPIPIGKKQGPIVGDQPEIMILDTNRNIHITEAGPYFYADDDEPVYRSEVLHNLSQMAPKVLHKVLVFDCCRQNDRQTGGSEQQDQHDQGANYYSRAHLTVHSGGLDTMSEALNNVYILSSTVPHHRAWADETGTRFTDALATEIKESTDSEPFGCIDERINRRMKEKSKWVTPQRTEMVKWVTEPFVLPINQVHPFKTLLIKAFSFVTDTFLNPPR